MAHSKLLAYHLERMIKLLAPSHIQLSPEGDQSVSDARQALVDYRAKEPLLDVIADLAQRGFGRALDATQTQTSNNLAERRERRGLREWDATEEELHQRMMDKWYADEAAKKGVQRGPAAEGQAREKLLKVLREAAGYMPQQVLKNEHFTTGEPEHVQAMLDAYREVEQLEAKGES